MSQPARDVQNDWRPNWIATCFAGARVRIADGGDPVTQNTEAELTMLRVIEQCEDGCSLSGLNLKVFLRLHNLGYYPPIATAWIEDRAEAAWEMFRKAKKEASEVSGDDQPDQ